ncbi:type I polyketide synthase [Streptomyces sp. NPDC002519]
MDSDLIKALADSLREHAAGDADRIAFEDDRRAVGYGELELRTRRIAGHLAALGVARGARVAIHLRNSVATVESYLAVARAACVGVPVNPASTRAELDYLLADSGASVVITDPAGAAQLADLPALSTGVVVLVTGPVPESIGAVQHLDFEELASTEPELPARDDLGLHEVAWIFYTSGTTGKPKGVLSTQYNCLYSVAMCYVPIPGLTAADRVVWPLPLFHSLSHIACVLAVTTVGATARLLDGGSADDVLTALRETRATFVAGVPTIYQNLIGAARDQQVRLPDLRVGLVGGAVAGPELCRTFRDTFGVPLVDAYGSTETCGAITMNPPDGTRVDGSCGLPAPGVRVRIVDPDTGADVPAGDEGEVWVSGPNVMVGYHNLPELTASVLRDGWYRTGDLARRDEAGYFTVCGRISELIIRGGENFHPEEIEAAIRASAGVRDVAVVGAPDDLLGEVPAAYVVEDRTPGLDVPALIRHCRTVLSAAKVPETVHQVAEIPRTASGKVQRRLLGGLPALQRYAADGHHQAVLETVWVPAELVRAVGPGPRSWALVGPDAAVLAAMWPGDAGVVRAYEDLAAVGETEAVILLPLDDQASGTDDSRRNRARRLADGLTDWLARADTAAARLLVVTRRGVSTGSGDEPADLAQSLVRAVAVALQDASPDRVGVLDLAAGTELDGEALRTALTAAEPQAALRAGGFVVPRLARRPLADTPAATADGAVLVIGADTERGVAVADHLRAVHPVTDVVALSTADALRPRTLRGALAATPPAAVIVTQGAPDVVAQVGTALDAERSAALLVIADPPADTEAAILGAELASAVAERRRNGLPTALLTWDHGSGRDGLSALDALLAAPDVSPLVALRPARPEPGAPVPPLLRNLFAERVPQARPDEAVAAALREELGRLTEHAQLARLRHLVCAQAVAVAGLPESEPLPADRAFRDLGFTSSAVVELRNRLVLGTGLRLPVSISFDHPTPRALAAHLHAELTRGARTVAEAVPHDGADPEEPIAIIGMACRLPGGTAGPDDLWRLVLDGREVLSPFPEDRGWNLDALFDADPGRPGTSYLDRGGFLDGAGDFDAGFFGISPREAMAMDPQQRQLLETSWEAMEHAGLDVAALRGSDVGVYFGLMDQGYGGSGQPSPELAGFTTTGTASSVASGRVSYSFGFQGPAVTVDTACSSSLVAMHLAGQALRGGECTVALAGGATVMATPRSFVEFSRQQALAADGRCKSYGASADGTSWAEGAAVLVLTRLSDARRAGQRVLAVLRGSATNQDGASNGLTAPSGQAQQRVIGRALAAAGLTAADVDVVEGHGTGTVLGDPIEIEALLATYGAGRRPEQPLWLGSLKSNLGHTQAASGVAGVIKMVQALRHGTLPRTLHADEPTDRVDWSVGAVELLTANRPWPDHGRPRRAGVSSFGLSGTNAHVILEQAPEDLRDAAGERGAAPTVVPVVVSAASPEALRAQAARTADLLAGAEESRWVDIAAALIARRTVLRERAVVLAASREEALAGLTALAEGTDDGPLVVRGGTERPDAARGVVLVFPGQGAQWRGMGRELLDTWPVFARRIEECARHLADHVDWSLLDVLRGEVDDALLQRVDVVQPASFAVMVGLATVWEALGVTPQAVVGHSQGEVAAAYVAGALSLEDAVRVVAVRSRAIAATLAGRGGMASVSLPADEAVARLAAWSGRVEVAAVNGPSSVVVSGTGDALDEALAVLEREGVRTRRVAVDYASHTRQVESVRAALEEGLSDLDVRTPTVPFHSTVTAERLADVHVLDGDYWYRNLRQQVRFSETVAGLVDEGFDVFVESGSHPVLAQPIAQIAEAAGADVLLTGTLRRGDGGPRRLLTSAAELFVRGVPVDWSAVLPAGGAEPAELPPYPFERQHYWLPSTTDAPAAGPAETGHPLLGQVVHMPDSGIVATARWTTQALRGLLDDPAEGRVLDEVLIEVAVRAGDETGTPVVDELTVDESLTLPAQGALDVRVVVGKALADGLRPIDVHSRAEVAAPDAPWVRHAHGRLAHAARARHTGDPADAAIDADVTFTVAVDDGDIPDARRFGLHPLLLARAVRAAVPDGHRPRRWQDVGLLATGASAVHVTAASTRDGARRAHRLVLADPAGQPVLRAERIEVRPAPAATRAPAGIPEGLFRTEWLPGPVPHSGPTDSFQEVRTAQEVERADAELMVFEPATDTGDPRTAVNATLAVLQAFLAGTRHDSARLVVVTGDTAEPASAAVWGLVRSAQSEQPGRIVLVDAAGAGGAGPRAADLVAGLADEPQLRLRDGGVQVPRLTRVAADAWPVENPVRLLDPAGTVLITGGTGTLGALTARHLVTRHGIRHLLLAGRRGQDADGARALRDELRALGADVRFAAADVADRDQVAALLALIPREHPLTAVVHCAGVLDDGVITELSDDRVDTVLRPKTDAARHLDELTRDLPGVAFVLFSSAAGVLGNPGQGNYAAANAALDALAVQRRAAGLHAVSLAWGYWESVSGLTGHLGSADLRRNHDLGMAGLSDAHGLALLDAALADGTEAALVAADFDFAVLRGAATALPAPLRGLVPAVRATATATAATGPASGSFAERIAALPDQAARSEALLALVRQHAAAILGHRDATDVRADRAFKDAGFDSLTALELRNRLAAATSCRLASSVVFDYPTPTVLAGHLRDKLLGETPTDAPAETVAATGLATDEPIAIVSMACRFPGGVHSPEDLWRVLVDETDVVSAFPDDRGWDVEGVFHPDPDHPGTTYVRHGAFLEDAAGFDSDFFGISPNEALAMDPQQRLLLETSWETLERAGIDPRSLAGQDVGVFVGVNSHDWLVRTHDAADVEGFRLTGTSGSVLTGRIAYHLGLQGPAITVDTACSSSLVAVHLAAQSLRAGECTMALVGGVMVMSTVETFVEFSRQRGLAPDGRCKAFADAADGTGWSEGVGLLLVEPLSAARRNGHQVLAVISGSAVNQDGASNGLTAPNGPAQQQVIRKALTAAGVRPAEVDVVEAHGTGTTLGDPIEAHALLEVYGRGRPEDRPLWLGSVKSNIGHTQAAAGVAGIIKMVQAIRHGRLPRTLHVDRPSTHVDWSAGAVRLLTEARDWPRNAHPRRAGVSSFGIGGTNAHLVLEQASDGPEPVTRPDTPWTAVPFSARTPQALRDQAGRLADFLGAREDLSVTDTALALAAGRAHLDRRGVLVVRDRSQLIEDLEAVRRGAGPAVTGRPVTGKLAFLFTGQGSQWAGMGRELAAFYPVFAAAFTDACRAVEKHLRDAPVQSLTEVVFAEPDTVAAKLLDQTRYTQAGLFALETALFRLLESWGIKPDLMAGHSIGELAAAHAAGLLDLDTAGELVAARGGLMQALPDGGAMLAVEAGEAEVMEFVAASAGAVGLAAVNSPDSVVLSGDEAAVLAAEAEFRGRGRRTRRLQVSHAFHSARMEPMLAGFRAVAERQEYRHARVPLVSTLTGRVDTDGHMGTADYWVDQIRGTVRFADAVHELLEQGATTFLEVGPGGVLTAMAAQTPGIPADGCVAGLRKSGAEQADVLTAVAELYVRGIEVDWPSVLWHGDTDDAELLAAGFPTYPFQRRRYWVDGGGAVERPVPVPVAEPPAGERDLLEAVLDSVRLVLGYREDDADMVDDERSFKDLGFDSLAGVRLASRLQDATGIEVPTSAVFNYPTPKALAECLSRELSGVRAPQAVTSAPAESDEPIAIVGTSVRLPGGVDSPEGLWRLVAEERDAITGFPTDRGWDIDRLYHPDPAHPGTSYTRSGGFLHDAAQFDAALFGISPREALAMDPQQRLLLETSWEALERVGVDPLSLRGQDVGVFTGIVHHDYVTRLNRVPDEAQGYVMTGTSPSVASGRVSYVFGFEGPAISIDTACSSSLVAMHLAAQALRRGECSMALAGGATVMASPTAFVEFSRQRGLSADGRCKAFSDTADGTGWSEGVGVVVLERLSEAVAKGHPVLAVIRGSAVTQDGASNGLTAPNGLAQQRVIRQALASAGLRPGEVDAVEAHGTGTSLGDPIEAQSLIAVYGTDRDPGQPLWLGSLKSNIGHTQAAAGVAGVVKMVEALRRAELPATLHVEAPTSQVDWDSGTVRLLTEAREWPRTAHPRRAAVSAFGASGTNAHLILEQAPAPDTQLMPGQAPGPDAHVAPWQPPVADAHLAPGQAPAADDAPPSFAPTGDAPAVPLVLSARTRRSLAAQAARLLDRVTEDGTLPAVASRLATGRALLAERAVLVADSAAAAQAGLAALAKGDVAPQLFTGTAARPGGPGKVVMVFPGQGTHWAGMGAAMLDASAVFRERVAACAQVLGEWVDWSLMDVLSGTGDPALLERVDVIQPAGFAVMVGLAAVWESLGVRPDAVLGHSQGEIAAACVAGALSLADAARIVALRSQEIARTLSGRGGMVSVRLGEHEARELIAPWADRLEVAVVNGSSAVVVAGDSEPLREAVATLHAQGITVREVPVDYASHTRHVEDIEGTLAEVLRGITAHAPAVPFYSTVTGDWVVDRGVLDGGYWYRNLREQVGFGPAVTELLDQGYGAFVEVSAHPVLVQSITDLVDEQRTQGAGPTRPPVAGTLRRGDGGMSCLLGSAAQLFTAGVPVDWTAALPADTGPAPELPTYAFERQHFWLTEPEQEKQQVAGPDSEFWSAIEQADTTALGRILDLPGDGIPEFAAVLPVLGAWRRRSNERSEVKGLRYTVGWKPVEQDLAGVPGGRWLAVVPADGAADELIEAVRGRGLDVVTLAVRQQSAAAEVDDLLALALAEHESFTGVLSLLALDGDRDAADPTAVTTSTLDLLQALATTGDTGPLWCLTRGAVNIGIRDRVSAPAHAALWGLGRAAALERPDGWGGLIDLPADTDSRAVGRLLAVLAGGTGEDQLAIRRSGTYVRRLRRAAAPDLSHGRQWRTRGTVLVTGGAEGLGLRTARRLAEAGADRLVVTVSEASRAEEVTALRAELDELGTDIVLESCPEHDREAILRLVRADPDRPLTAIVHAADLAQTSRLDETGRAEVATVYDAKVATALWLAEQFADAPLEAFVIYTSIAGIWGGAGQGLSGAANAVLDALADRLRGAGCPAISIAWGALTEAGVGMDEVALVQLRRLGLLPMTPASAMTVLEQAVLAEEKSTTAAGMDWSTFLPTFTSVRPSPFLSDLPEAGALRQAAQAGADGATQELGATLRTATEAEQKRLLLRLVRSHAAAVLGHSSADGIGPAQAFQEVGFDSLAAVTMRNGLISATGLQLPTTLVFDYPNPEALADYLRTELLRENDQIADRESEIRRILATVPFERFRDAGILTALLGLSGEVEKEEEATADGSADDTSPEPDDDVDTLDVESLVQRVLGATS